MLSADERALLLLLKRTDPEPALGSSDIPQGLPGALVWAVASTRRLFDPSFLEQMNSASGDGRRSRQAREPPSRAYPGH